jgi:hypothetical protein
MLIGKGGVMDEPLTYTTYEAAKINGVDESTIRRQCADGRLPGAYRAIIREREIWMIPAAALGMGRVDDVLQHIPEELESDQPVDPA